MLIFMFLYVEGHWAPWSEWSQCSEGCLSQNQSRTRNVSFFKNFDSKTNFSVWKSFAIEVKIRSGPVLVVLGRNGQVGQSVLKIASNRRKDQEHSTVQSPFKQSGIRIGLEMRTI